MNEILITLTAISLLVLTVLYVVVKRLLRKENKQKYHTDLVRKTAREHYNRLLTEIKSEKDAIEYMRSRTLRNSLQKRADDTLTSGILTAPALDSSSTYESSSDNTFSGGGGSFGGGGASGGWDSDSGSSD